MSTTNNITNIRKNVREKFNELKSALTMREKLLLRQLDVINNARKQQQQQELVTVNVKQKKSCDATNKSESSPVESPSSSMSSNNDDIQFLCENEKELLENIRNYGRYQITTTNMSNLIFQDFLHLKNEDYIIPNNDHEIFYKDLTKLPTTTATIKASNEKNGEEEAGVKGHLEYESPETIMVDFSQQKLLMEDNARKMNESIINITLSEAKELIKKAKMRKEYIVPPLNLEELDDNMESSLAEAVSSLTVSESINEPDHEMDSYNSYNNSSNNNNNENNNKNNNDNDNDNDNNNNNKYSQTQTSIFKDEGKRFKPKITINNCNGTINLRNIAALTINCTTEDKLQTQLPVNNRNYTSNTKTAEKQHTTNDLTKRTKQVPPKSCQYQAALPIITASSSTSNNNNVSTTTNNRSSSSDSSTITTTPISVSNSINNNNLYSQYKKHHQPPAQQQKQQQQQRKQSSISKNETMKYQDKIDYQIGTSEESSTSDGTATCDFYNRLLNEIKKTIKQNQYKYQMAKKTEEYPPQQKQQQQLNELTDQNIVCERPKRFVLKNFENLRIILEARNGPDDETFHPVQIEQWLADIIADTDLEPMQNIDILEYSNIHTQPNHQHQQQENSMMLEEFDENKQAN